MATNSHGFYAVFGVLELAGIGSPFPRKAFHGKAIARYGSKVQNPRFGNHRANCRIFPASSGKWPILFVAGNF